MYSKPLLVKAFHVKCITKHSSCIIIQQYQEGRGKYIVCASAYTSGL